MNNNNNDDNNNNNTTITTHIYELLYTYTIHHTPSHTAHTHTPHTNGSRKIMTAYIALH
jgi:hypothetical protein